jgi:hypothetical protein
MNPLPSSNVGRSVCAVGCVVLLAWLSATVANTQGISAGASTAKPNAAPDINVLRQQVLALEQRLAKLERDQLEQFKLDDASDEARARKLEQRLASLEKSGKPESAGTKPGADAHAAITVTAPFTVVDSAGKILMRVAEAGEGFSRGMYIYDTTVRAVAHVGVLGSNDGGRVYVTSVRSTVPSLAMTAGADGPTIQAKTDAGKLVATVTTQGIFHYNAAEKPVAYLTSKDQKGILELTDANGSKMVEAGSLAGGKGYVLVNPYHTSVAPGGDPSVLMGGRGK